MGEWFSWSAGWVIFWCTVAHMIVNGVIILYCFTRVADWHWRDVQLRIDIWTFPISLGMVIFSYTSQIFLPSTEGNMVDRASFGTMLDWTHLAAAVFKVGFSYVGFVTFGDATQEVITNNLPDQALKTAVNLCLVAKALLSYPLPYFAAVELFEAAMFRGRPETVFASCYDQSPAGSLRWWAVGLRLVVVVLTMIELRLKVPLDAKTGSPSRGDVVLTMIEMRLKSRSTPKRVVHPAETSFLPCCWQSSSRTSPS